MTNADLESRLASLDTPRARSLADALDSIAATFAESGPALVDIERAKVGEALDRKQIAQVIDVMRAAQERYETAAAELAQLVVDAAELEDENDEREARADAADRAFITGDVFGEVA